MFQTSKLLKTLVFLMIFAATPMWAANALIVHDGTPGIEADALSNLTAKLVAASFTVTPSVGVPGGSLATYQQIWDIRFNNTTPLSGSDNTAYLTYLQGGGNLFLMGENAGFATRNASILTFLGAAGAGNIKPLATPGNTETVSAPFTGPNAVSSITYLAADGFDYPPGNGAQITRDGTSLSAAVVFPPGKLTNAAAGSLIVVLDVNFMQTGADANSQALLANMIAYLAAPTPVTLFPPVPAMSTIALALLACLLVAISLRLSRG